MEVFATLQEGFMVRQTERLADRQTQTDRKTDRQTDTDPVAGTWRWCGSICNTAGRIHGQTDREAGRQTDTDRQKDRQTDRQTLTL